MSVQRLRIQKHLFIWALSLSLLLFSCDKYKKNEVPGPNQVWMEGNKFVPEMMKIDSGESVTWTNKDNTSHTVTSKAGLFSSGLIGPGETFNLEFADLGEFAYICTIHEGMEARVVVIP